MKTTMSETGGFEQILTRKAADVVQALRKREYIAIEKSPDQMDATQYASERDLAIGNLDRGSKLLREVRAALQRIHDGSFGICIQCEGAISMKRLMAVPWAPRCIQCKAAADRQSEATEFATESLASAA